MKQEIRDAIDRRAKTDDASLYAQLGYYSQAFPQNPQSFASAATDIAIDETTAGPLDEAILLGKRILRRWSRVLHDLACGTGGDAEVRRSIETALKTSPAALATTITAVLISTFSVAPAIAVLVGILLGKVLLPAAHREICDFWGEKL